MDEIFVRLGILVLTIAVVSAAGLWWRRREGRIQGDGDGRFADAELDEVGLARTPAAVRALLLSSPTCGPCRSVKEILAEVATQRPDFRWVSVDAGDHLAIAREHHVLRVPTLFVLDRQGRIIARTSGVPAARELIDVVAEVSAASE